MRSIAQIEADIATQERHIKECLAAERSARILLERAQGATLKARQQLGRLISERGAAGRRVVRP